ncbi:pectin lyase fold/virulence factor [Xylariaceae sp. FL0594]|nr:pectin lyase fold/virulence factor [Xylariaceae sp. FL0594]
MHLSGISLSGAPVLVLALAWLTTLAQATTTTFYMSPAGNDSASGTSASTALKTLKGVHAKVAASKPRDAINVVIAEGTYTGQSVSWSYFNGQAITFSPPSSSSSKPIFDGQGTGLTWFTVYDSPTMTNLRFVNLTVTNYWLGLDLGKGGQGQNKNGGNEVRGMLFERVGAFYTHNLPDPKGYAALRLRGSSNNTIVGNRFHGVKNPSSAPADSQNVTDFTGYIHAIYLAHGSRANLIRGNEFNQVTGDAVRTRDGSGENVIEGNRFVAAGKYSAYSDWIDDEEGDEECPSWNNRFTDNVVGQGYFGPFKDGYVTHVYGPDDRCSPTPGSVPPPRIIESGTVMA